MQPGRWEKSLAVDNTFNDMFPRIFFENKTLFFMKNQRILT